jgi:hypothetical protein
LTDDVAVEFRNKLPGSHFFHGRIVTTRS